MSIFFSDIANILQATPIQQCTDPAIDALLTDSRKLLFPAATLFFSISSQQKNANDFIGPLYKRGVRCFITDNEFNNNKLKKFPEGNFIKTENVLFALQAIAAHHRKQFQYPVIGITGSNGKTITKEWLYQLLHGSFNIIRSPKSYNSQIGVPLSVWQMSETHNLAIFEAGISKIGEMERLQKVIDPQIGIITYTGEAHAENFKTIHEKITEKLQLFKNSELLFYCSDDEALQQELIKFKATQNKDLKLFDWSAHKDAGLRITQIDKQSGGTNIHCRYLKNNFAYFIPFTDDASINNSITCCAVLLNLNNPEFQQQNFNLLHSNPPPSGDFSSPSGRVREGLEGALSLMSQLRPVEMRLELKQGLNNCSIINDSYSLDINSLTMGLDFLEQQHQHPKRTLILSDVLQSGIEGEKLYPKIAEIVKQKKIDHFIGIGPHISLNAYAFDDIPKTSFYHSTEDFLQQINKLDFLNETILLKGARVFHFEKISRALEQKIHETILEIDLNALRYNLKFYRQFLKENVKIMAMVKAFSYGSGSFEIANLLQHAGIDYLAVAYADEGVELRKAGISLPIMVMNTEEAGFDNLVKNKLEPELYSFKIANAFRQYLQQHEIEQYPVHIKLDTGMHRLGFEPTDTEQLISLLKIANPLKVISVFSHLVASDDIDEDDFTKQQAELFLHATSQIEACLGYKIIKHISNTSAIHRHTDLQMDMVRLGIGLYGVDADKKVQKQLKNVTTLKTTISQIKHVKKGETVGYGRHGKVKKDSVIATVRIGYADGYPRLLSNGSGKMMINSQSAPVIGNVCMDMTMLDITGLIANEGDEVIVFGEDLPVTTIAKWAKTIAYEILTNVSQRVKRVYFEE